jgi:3-hydroxyisobutyrate dehydrogenase-like beta-hydroxyacid dehydrogenase
MSFNLLLWALGRILARAAKKNRAFQRLASGIDTVVQVRSGDSTRARHYIFKNDMVKSAAGSHRKPDLDIVMRDDRYGYSTLRSRDRSAFRRGMAEGDIRIEGDFALLIWFRSLIETARKVKKHIPPHCLDVGFIGTGFIGAPMARTLVRDGFRVKVFDKNRAAMEPVIAMGAEACESLDEFSGVPTVIVMVNNFKQVRDVVTGLADVAHPGEKTTVIVMSTVSPDDIVEVQLALSSRGSSNLTLLDAPVSGAPLLAEAGELAIMAGGDDNVFEEVRPILESMGDSEKIFHLGPLGSGCAMKLVNNMIAITTGLTVFEALSLGVSKGMDPHRMARVINAGSGKNYITEQWPMTEKMIELILKDTTYDARSALFVTGLKDLKTAQAWAGPGIKTFSIERAIRQIQEMSEEELVGVLKTLIARADSGSAPLE